MSHERMFDFFVPASALSVQDIITLEPKERRFPKWVFNYMIGDGCPFKAIPTTVVPPACIPTNLGSLPLAIKITGEPDRIFENRYLLDGQTSTINHHSFQN